MGRKSLAPRRREEILQAVELCIRQRGLAGASFARIAELAGVQPSLIAHYFGSRDGLLDALVERVTARCRDAFADHVATHPEAGQVEAALDFLFGDVFVGDPVAAVVAHLVAEAGCEPAIRARLRQMYAEFEETCRKAVDASHPGAPTRRRVEMAYALMCLADANARFASLDADSAREDHARRAAETLLGSLP